VARPRPLRRFTAGVAREGAIALLVLAFVGFGVIYSLKTPLFEVPDEPVHYRYVQYLAAGRGLPPLPLPGPVLNPREAHQPPLYYLLGALLTRGIATGAPETLYVPNPYAALGLPQATSNKNAVLHLGGEEYPYQGVSLAVHILRWFSLLCSAGTVWLTYRLAQELVPGRRSIAIGAALLVALNPQFLFLSAGATNHALAILWATLALYLGLRVVNGHGHPYRTPLCLGAAVGLAALTALNGLATLLIIPGAYGLYLAGRSERRLWEDWGRPVLLAFGMAFVLCGWWYLRNAFLYGNVLALQAVRGALTPRQGSWRAFAGDFLRAVTSYWGTFGWLNIPADEIFYVLVRILSALGMVGLSLILAQLYWQRADLSTYRWRAAGLVGGWVLVVALSLMTWLRAEIGLPGYLMFPAIGAISLLLAVGLSAWVPRRHAAGLMLGLALFLGTASAVAPWRYIAPAYAPPKRLVLEQVPAHIQDIDVQFGEELFLLGYELPQESVTAGGALSLRLYWVALKRMSQDYTFYVHVLGRGGAPIGGVDTFPGGGSYPTRLWLPGEVVCDTYLIPIAANAEAPTAASVRVGVYSPQAMVELTARDAQGREIGHGPEILRVRLAPKTALREQPAKPAQFNFGDKIMLIGYDLVPPAPVEGRTWEIVLYWKALRWIPHDYTVFVHLVDQGDQLVSQVDEQPLQGEYPTRFWQMGEVVGDRHRLAIPQELASGQYYLQIGLYLLDTGARLPVVGADPPLDYVRLGPIQVQGSR
jgi:4-amino-4-deoxy-L-arabinose transferase-like glycosyltransferase